MKIHASLHLFAALLTFAAIACGQTAATPPPSAPTNSVGLDYENPGAGSGWSLVRDDASTDTLLLLDLVGPSGVKGRGVGFNLRSDGSINFAPLSAAGYVRDLGVFKLQSTVALYPVEPVLLAGGIKEGGALLTVGVFQKDRLQPAQDLDKAVLQIGIAFDSFKTGSLPPGTAIPLTITKSRQIPESIGVLPADPSDPAADWSSVTQAYAPSLQSARILVGVLKTR